MSENTTNNISPKLRFPQFTDPWEQRKLGDLTDFVTGKSFSADLSSNGAYVVMDMGTVSQEGNRIETKTTDVNRDVLNRNDLIMPKDDIGGGLIIGKTAHIPVDNRYVLGDHVYRLRFTNENGLFFHYQINSDGIRKQIMPLVTGSAQLGLNSKNIQSVYVNVPSIDEQAKIGELFSNLDNTITLHQRKCDSLKEYKKGMLQKMFPKEGETEPEIRFAGFTDSWEQRKLSELTTMHARIGWQNLRISEFLDSGDYMLITGTDFDDGRVNFETCHYVAKERYDQDKNIQVQNGSILITKDGTLGKVAYVQGLSMPATLNAGVFNVVIKDKNEIDEQYLYQYLKGPFLMDYVGQRATGGTIKHLNQGILVDFPVRLPSIEEQIKVGDLLTSLDNTITLHQRKVDKLKEYKKGLLQQMFV